jgi:hypothetical protein
MWALTVVEDPEWACFTTFIYSPILAHHCVLWPHSRAGNCYVADPSVCISLMPLLSMTELGLNLQQSYGVGPQLSWGSLRSGARGCRFTEP